MKSKKEITEYIQKIEKEYRNGCEELRNETKYMALKERWEAIHGILDDMMETLEIPTID